MLILRNVRKNDVNENKFIRNTFKFCILRVVWLVELHKGIQNGRL
jgi:hypothetical protein